MFMIMDTPTPIPMKPAKSMPLTGFTAMSTATTAMITTMRIMMPTAMTFMITTMGTRPLTAMMVMITTTRTMMPTAMTIIMVTTFTATKAMVTPTITIITPPWQASPPSLTVWIFQTR